MKKVIGIVTGTRADYGLLARTISLMQQDSRFQTKVFACGTHLSTEFGYTIEELKSDGVQNIKEVEMLMSTASKVGLTKSVGLGVIGFADAFSEQNLDAILILGDRFEILSAAQAAMFLGIPLIHMHGGEVTEGAFDDSIRHSVTKMANIHLPAANEFKDRILQLGEREESIFVIGSPGVDNIINTPRLDKEVLEKNLGFCIDEGPLALVTYHPVTQTNNQAENDIEPLLQAIRENPDITYIVTYPNADGGGDKIIKQWESIQNLPNIKIVPSLGFATYLSVMELVSCVIGNSSSGIVETPTFNVPSINIGTRQKGRPRASSVIDVAMVSNSISEAIRLTLDIDYKNSLLKGVVNPYGSGGAAEKVIDILANIDFSSFNVKTFTDYKLYEK
tara:strand:- start:77 stop:1249 length:1173 start_codon:yes stop_codon:yes gene_type:complete